MLKNSFNYGLLALFFMACAPVKEKADLLVYNARIYAVDSAFHTYEAMAVQNGRILELGSSDALLEKYEATERSDVQHKIIFPGLIDAHCHFLAYGLGLGQANLVGTHSFVEVLERVLAFAEKTGRPLDAASRKLPEGNNSWLLGRGWDQNDWPQKKYPDRRQLDSLFPHRPVLLMRVDGHAALVNSEALRLAQITAATSISGGEILKSQNIPTGMLIDNAVDLVKNKLPVKGSQALAEALLLAQQSCLAAGLTTVDDAGLMKQDIDVIDSLQRSGQLKMRVYAMLSDSQPNYAHYLQKGPYKTERLNVCSFKFYADGALGSRGACLFADYSDKPGWKGFLLSSIDHFKKQAALLSDKGFQVNTHCIGDSALHVILDIYTTYGRHKRWRIEHAQVAAEQDFQKFSEGIIPSVQPTHATSDMYWAGERLGPRLQYAYAYRRLLMDAGLVALGTDFPVEDISPFKTFFAAVARQDSSGFPPAGFQVKNALSREQALRGMTAWAAYANFEEHEKGSLEKGKLADFVILDTDLMQCPIRDVLKTNVLATYIGGEKVFTLNPH